MSKYADVIQKARQENQQTGKPENQVEAPVEEVNLSIKVPKHLRRHWVSEAKRQGTSLTAVIIQGLKERFGDPPAQEPPPE